jgi:hypothetical protein
VLRKRFGSLKEIYDLAGYNPTAEQASKLRPFKRKLRHPRLAVPADVK